MVNVEVFCLYLIEFQLYNIAGKNSSKVLHARRVNLNCKTIICCSRYVKPIDYIRTFFKTYLNIC